MSQSWYLKKGQSETGPVDSAQLSNLAKTGAISPDQLIRRSDMEKWLPASKVKGLTFPQIADSYKTDLESDKVVDVVEVIRTSTGRNVALLSNGTWRFETEIPNPNSSTAILKVPVPHSAKVLQFRKTCWGMSEREVRDSEDREPSDQLDRLLFYHGIVAGIPCEIIYIFVHNQLVRGKYRFTVTHSNPNEFISDFYKLKELMCKKYGKPISKHGQAEDMLWLDPLFQDDVNDWGRAVEAGHLMYFCDWDEQETSIHLQLSGDNYEASLVMEYTGKAFSDLEDAFQQQQHLDDL